MAIQSCDPVEFNFKFFIVSFTAVLFYSLAKKFLPRILKKFVPEWILRAADIDLDISSEDMKVQLLEVQKLDKKISEEKEILKSILSEVTNDDFQQEVHKILADLQVQVKSRFEAIDSENKAKYVQVQEMMASLANEVSILKSQVVQNDKMYKSLELSRLEENSSGDCRIPSEATVQTEKSYKTTPQENSDLGFSDEEWMSLKQILSNAMVESEKLWKDAILQFFKNLEMEYESSKDLVLASWDGVNEEIASCGSILDEVHNVEQTVFGILIFLQQQSVEAQNALETLKFFSYKFKSLHQKSDARWKKSNLNLEVAFDSVQNSQAIMNVSSLTFKNMTDDVQQRFECLGQMVMRFGYAAKLLNDAKHLTYSMERNVCDLIADVTSMSSKIEGTYCQKMSKISEELLEPGEKLFTLLKTLEELRIFGDGFKLLSKHPSIEGTP